MKVSVITPFYEGNEYIENYKRMMQANAFALSVGDSIEVVLVNDSPWCEVQGIPSTEGIVHQKEETKNEAIDEQLIWRSVTNSENSGIHASRVHGLNECNGEFIIFLDQDDILADDAIAEFIKQVELTTDMVVSNAILENATGEELWYRSAYHKSKVDDIDTYLKVGTQIISPGQCLIRRTAIPEIWKNNVGKKNGSDDYYLWLLMLNDKKRFIYVDKPLYTHKYTAKNLSADTKVTDDSTYEFIKFLEADDNFNPKSVKVLKRMISYKDKFRNGGIGTKLIQTICNLDIFIPNLIFKKKSKTPYGFNR